MTTLPRLVAAVVLAATSCTWPIPIGVQDAGACGDAGRLGSLEVDPSFAACGTFVLDVGGVDNVDYGVQGVATQADGRIVLVGTGGTPLDTNLLVLRLRESGELDHEFGDAGLVELDFGGPGEACQAVVIQPDDRLLLAGEAQQPTPSPVIARLLADGAVDSSFRAGRVELGTNQALFNGVAVLPDGRIRAAGQGWPMASGASGLQVYGLLADGRLDTAFGAGGLVARGFAGLDEFGGALVSDPSGRLLVPGMGETSGGFDFVLDRLLESGLPDPSFGDGGRATADFFGGDDGCDEVAVQPDGKLLCGGQATQGGTSVAALARFLPDGTADETFGTGGKVILEAGAPSAFHALKVLPDGRIVAGGWVRSSRGDDDLLLAIFSASGALDESEGPATLTLDVDGGSRDSVAALLPDDRGRLLVFGSTASRADGDLLLLRLSPPAAGQQAASSRYQVALGCGSAPVSGADSALFLLGLLPWVTRRRTSSTSTNPARIGNHLATRPELRRRHMSRYVAAGLLAVVVLGCSGAVSTSDGGSAGGGSAGGGSTGGGSAGGGSAGGGSAGGGSAGGGSAGGGSAGGGSAGGGSAGGGSAGGGSAGGGSAGGGSADGGTGSTVDTTPPTITAGQPVGVLAAGTTQVTMRVTTNEAATCRWGTAQGTAYGSMANTFTATGSTAHSTTLTGLQDGQSYSRSVRCQDGAGNANPSDYTVTFGVGTVPTPLRVSFVASRTSGVGPLSVFFDASGTTDTAMTSRPFHDLEYRWDFGDPLGSPVSGTTWATGSGAGVNSRNAAMGPVAAHVFERPGTYTVSLSVFDGTNMDSAVTTITVDDPDVVFAGTNTICFSASATYADCPTGATHVQTSNFATAINTYQASNHRLLFRRGETFTSTARSTINSTGPGIIGAYSSGAPPVIQSNGTAQVLIMSSSTTPGIRDWRVMDLVFDGNSDALANDNTGIQAGGGINELLVLRMNIRNIHTGISAGPHGLDYANSTVNSGHTIFEDWAVVDSLMTGMPLCAGSCDWRIYLAGKRISIQGNDMDNEDSGGTHVIRNEYMAKGVISNNTIARPGGAAHAIKLHARDWTTPGVTNPGGVGTYSEQIIISDNRIIGNTNAWTVSLGPQNDGTVPGQPADERVRDVIFERNWLTGGAGTQLSVESSAARSTFRNNIIDTTNGRWQTGIAVGRRGTEPIPDDVHIYNNTLYSGSAASEYAAIRFGVVAGIAVRNNVGYAPLASNPAMLLGTPSGLVQSNNSSDGQVKSTFPGWSAGIPSVPLDFAPGGGSYVLGAGVAVPVFSDFFGTMRPRGVPDIGAVGGP